MPNKNKDSGFTLIELSIVLVVIGLIVGGVLVGQDLINAAKIRSQVSQLESYKTAVYAFKVKYNYYPGDLPATEASALGFTSRLGTVNNGDGNGQIDYCVNNPISIGCEHTLFWNDLSSAGMISETFNTATNDAINNGLLTTTPDQLYKYFPKGKLRDNSYITASYDAVAAMNNRFIINTYDSINAGATSVPRTLTPMEAFKIDLKMDDGMPTTGKVWGNPTTASSSGCISTATGNPYNISNPQYADTVLCNIRFHW
jgi:prepilin-type N-terminal cleavage/methylation domain-containing protein